MGMDRSNTGNSGEDGEEVAWFVTLVIAMRERGKGLNHDEYAFLVYCLLRARQFIHESASQLIKECASGCDTAGTADKM
jgi:hypothetical protein